MSEKRKFSSLEDWRKADGRPMEQKKCPQCGKPITNPRFDLCRDCSQTDSPSRSSGPTSNTSDVSADYLKEGYFDAAGNLREELITSKAQLIANDLCKIRLSSVQLRKFYAHARQLGRQLENGEAFATIRPALLEMQPLVADAVGRAHANGAGNYELFKQFIDKNVELAAREEKNLREGFLKHFMYVVAYFKYLNPKG